VFVCDLLSVWCPSSCICDVVVFAWRVLEAIGLVCVPSLWFSAVCSPDTQSAVIAAGDQGSGRLALLARGGMHP
jgi:hypothetical protein